MSAPFMCVSDQVCVHVCLAVPGRLFRNPLWIISTFLLKSECVLYFLPVSELRAQSEVVREEVLLWRDGSIQPEEGVVLHTRLPQVFTGPVVHHVETQQRFPALRLCAGRGREH